MRPNWERDLRTYVWRLAEYVTPGRLVARITRADMFAFQELALAMPARPSHALRVKMITEIVDATRGDSLVLHISSTTLRKWLDLLGAMFNWAADQGIIAVNSIGRGKPRRRKGIRKPRIAFKARDISAIFASPVYHGCRSGRHQGQCGTVILRDALYWLPILALFNGARLNEIGQCLLPDIASEHGIDYLQLTTENDDEETDDAKQFKTEGSLKVPLQIAIIDAGFLDYVSDLRTGGRDMPLPRSPARWKVLPHSRVGKDVWPLPQIEDSYN